MSTACGIDRALSEFLKVRDDEVECRKHQRWPAEATIVKRARQVRVFSISVGQHGAILLVTITGFILDPPAAVLQCSSAAFFYLCVNFIISGYEAEPIAEPIAN
ncbi:hypothetical protein B0H19DRAFT_1072131 [Mycena capillaripes]|nr:hypothetical protein B0H19DRAFT_1072131 [Mycena capillaripes]